MIVMHPSTIRSTLAVFLACAVRGAMGRYQAVAPPTSLPVFFSVGSAIALWGLALLAGALPNLACAPTSRRALRHAAVGICTGAALVGLLSDAPSASQVRRTRPSRVGVACKVWAFNLSVCGALACRCVIMYTCMYTLCVGDAQA